MVDEAPATPSLPVPGPDVTEALPVGRRRISARAGREHRWWLTLAVIGSLLIAGAYWAGTKATSPTAIEKQFAPAPRTYLTAPMVLRRLSETLSVQGVIASLSAYRVDFGPVNVPGAQPIVTQQPARVGTVVSNGSLLAQVAGRPVFAMAGATPMYRDLIIGDQGPDVAQLQDDLSALGYPSQDTPAILGRDTMRAVEAFYRHSGYSLPTRASAAATTGVLVLPQAEVVFIPKLPAVIQSSSLMLGQPVSNPALVLASGRLRAEVQLTATQSALVQPGDPALLYVSGPGIAPTQVAAEVTVVRAAGQSGAIALLRPSRPLRRARVGDHVAGTIVIASTKTAVLAVPVAALYTTADGQAMVTVISRDKRINVPVSVGPEIAGYVPVRPLRGRLAAGQSVLVGE